MTKTNSETEEKTILTDSVSRWKVTVHTVCNYTLMFNMNVKDIKDIRNSLKETEKFKDISAMPTEFWVFLEASRRMEEDMKKDLAPNNKIARIEMEPN